MTRFAFLKKYFPRFAATLALLGLLVYVFFHVLSSNEPPMTTPAYLHTDYQIVGGEAYLFREERVLTTSRPGVILRFAENGEKIAKGSRVAEVWDGYNDENRASAQLRLDAVERMIAVLEDSRLSAGTTLSKAELFRREAEAIYIKLRRALARGEREELRALSDTMLALLNRYRTLIGSEEGVESTLEALRAERDAILRGTPLTVYNSEASGYFYDASRVDGYESLFTASALESLTVESFESLIDAEPPEEAGYAVGKMAMGNRWYLAVAIDASCKSFFEAGADYGFTFPDNADRELTLICERLVEAADGRAVAIFFTDEVPSDFIYLRSQRVQITVGSFVGYHVPEAAMRVRDGVEGVFIFEESTVRFRRVEVLYRGDGYCIVAEEGDREGYLSRNDMMITSGENLYEGRVYR